MIKLKYPECTKVGAIIKISGDYDVEQDEENLKSVSNLHNCWATIIKIKDGKKHAILDVVSEDDKVLQIVDKSIKWGIGDMENDWVGIGKDRHAVEVVSEIKRVVKKFKL